MSVGARCRITKIHQSTFGYSADAESAKHYNYFADAKSASHYEMITLDCPNGEYDFLEHVVRENFTRCPREVAFEKLGL
jgi:hypothetical protein